MKKANCVYKFINSKDEIIYVGRAEILENRINKKGHTSKHLPQECYDQIAVIQYVSFNTENDMDFAERYYIKKYRPKYNDKHVGKPITMDLKELDNKNWTTYHIKVEEVLKQINDFMTNESQIKLDINILDFALMFTLFQHEQFKVHEQYRAFEERHILHELKNTIQGEHLEEEYKNYENLSRLDELINIKNKIRNKIDFKLGQIFDKYKLLKYDFGYDFKDSCYIKENSSWNIDAKRLSNAIDLYNNQFVINLYSNCKYNTNESYRFRHKMIVKCK